MKKTLQFSKITLDFDFAIRFINNDTISVMILELYTSLYILVDFIHDSSWTEVFRISKKSVFHDHSSPNQILPSIFTSFIHSRRFKAHHIFKIEVTLSSVDTHMLKIIFSSQEREINCDFTVNTFDCCSAWLSARIRTTIARSLVITILDLLIVVVVSRLWVSIFDNIVGRKSLER